MASKVYEVVKAFEWAVPGETPEQYAAGGKWELPKGWTEVDKDKHPTLSGSPYPVFQFEIKTRTKDENGQTKMRVEAKQVSLPVRAVA